MNVYDTKELETRFSGKIQQNVDMSRYTTYKIGGTADLFMQVTSIDDFVDAVVIARNHSIPVTVLGGGSNILVGDKGIRGLVLKNSTKTIKPIGLKGVMNKGLASKTLYIQADSGVSVNALVRFTLEEGMKGLETHLGLPGTVGGALYMNSKWGRPLTYIGDVVYQAQILTPRNTIQTVGREYFKFGYDSSTIQYTNDIVLTVTFQLQSAEKDQVWDIANQTIQYRHATQPQGVFTAGCVFRNVDTAIVEEKGLPKEAVSAGYLIDKAGMKGVSEGDARFSDNHANFIINSSHARASDVLKLINRAKEQVKKKFGITLSEEIVILGDF